LLKLIAERRTHLDSKIWSVITWTEVTEQHNLSHAYVQSRSNAIPSLSHGSLAFRSIPTGFFKSPLKTSTELGLRHGRGKTNRVTLIICTGFRKPEGISNSDARERRYVRYDQCVIRKERKIFQKLRMRMTGKKFASSSPNIKVIFRN